MDTLTITNKTMNILNCFKDINCEMPLQQMETFLAVARMGKCTVAELDRHLPQQQQAIARNVRILCAVASPTREGFDLIQQVLDIHDSRKRQLTLTDKGERLIKNLAHSLEVNCE
mgnify:CR=1 FL=1